MYLDRLTDHRFRGYQLHLKAVKRLEVRQRLLRCKRHIIPYPVDLLLPPVLHVDLDKLLHFGGPWPVLGVTPALPAASEYQDQCYGAELSHLLIIMWKETGPIRSKSENGWNVRSNMREVAQLRQL